MMAMPKFKAESGAQLFARLLKKPVIQNFYPNLFQPGLKYDDTVEIIGDKRTSYLLIDLICEALVHRNANENPIGVLFLNTVGQLNFKELINILKRKIILKNANSADCQNEMDSIIQRTLSNLFILDIFDATQFYTTIYNLDNILTKHQNISLLVFDTLTAFYWSEQGFKIKKMDSYIKNVLNIIQKVTQEYKVTNIYTRPGYFSLSKNTANQENAHHQIAEGLNYRVQLSDNNSTMTYQIYVTSLGSYKKTMNIIDNEVKWH